MARYFTARPDAALINSAVLGLIQGDTANNCDYNERLRDVVQMIFEYHEALVSRHTIHNEIERQYRRMQPGRA